jgi:hypothetical protein
MSEEGLTQINIAVPSDALNALCGDYGWTRQQAVTTALQALAVLMGVHEMQSVEIDERPENADIAALYLRFAREAPAGLIRVRDDLEFGHLADGRPALRSDGWLIFKDENSPAVMALKEATGQLGRVAGGEIKPLKLPTADEAALN